MLKDNLFKDMVNALLKNFYNATIVLNDFNSQNLPVVTICSIHEEFKHLKLTDLRIIATLGVGGFGRVELVQIAGDVKKRSYALKQMKKAQVRRLHKLTFPGNERAI